LPVDGKRWLLRPSLRRSASATSLAIRIYDPEDVGASLERIVLNGMERLTLREAMGISAGLVVLSAPPHGASDRTFWGLVNLALEMGRSALLVGAPLPHPGAGALPDLTGLPGEDAPRLQDPAPAAGERTPPAILLYAIPSGGAIRAALEAAHRHLVVLRLEASDGRRALARLAASDSDVMAPAGILRLLVVQRSMRRICDHCFTSAHIQPDDLRRFGLSDSECLGLKVYRGAGCEYCASSPGYRGREIALELVPSTPALEDLFLTGRLPDATSALPRPAGLRTLRRACLDLVDRGVTTLEEFRKLGLADRSTTPGSAGHRAAPISPAGSRSGAPGRRRDAGR
jgi:type IV pilus assembly protein PilB